MSERLSTNIGFFLVDQRYAAFELRHLDQLASIEHPLLFQSNILYDPHGFLEQKRRQLAGRIFDPVVRSLVDTLRWRVSQIMPKFLNPDLWDDYHLERSGQLQWVHEAIRCLRDAVAVKAYASTGTFIYKKSDVLQFYREHLPDDFEFIQALYSWKTDPEVRAQMAEEFKGNRGRHYTRFTVLTPQLQEVVKKVHTLIILDWHQRDQSMESDIP